MSVLPAESNISMAGTGIVGRNTSGAGKSARLSAAQVRSLCSVYSTSEVDTLLSGKANSSHTHAQSDVTGLVSALAAKADLVGGLVPSSQLPSYVDDVIEGANLAAFPATGETGKIYVALDTGKTYRWSGSAYVELTDATAVWGSISGTLSNQTDLQSALTARALTTTTISAGTGLSGGGDLSANRSLAVVYGTTSGTSCQGNDSRLSDARTPTSHTHTTADITGFGEAVDDEVASLLVAGTNITLTYNDAANTLTIAASGGGGSPGGSTKQVQFNSAGSFGGASGFEYQSGSSPNVLITSQSATHVPARIKGAASQSGNLLEAVNSADSLLFYVQSSGAIVTVNNITCAAQLTMNADVALRRIATGVFEINSSSAGTLRDLHLRNIGVNGSISAGGGVGIAFIANATTVPTTNPTGGGILYVEGGALKYRGSSGTVTTLGPA